MAIDAKKASIPARSQVGTTESVADFVVGTSFSQIPAEAISTAKYAILDSLGCALAGAHEPATEIITRYVRGLGGTPEAGVIAKGFKTAAPFAALVNGTMAHVLDYG